MKRVVGFVVAVLLAVVVTFCVTVRWSMENVEVYNTPEGVELVLCDNVWLHNAE